MYFPSRKSICRSGPALEIRAQLLQKLTTQVDHARRSLLGKLTTQDNSLLHKFTEQEKVPVQMHQIDYTNDKFSTKTIKLLHE